MALSIVQQVTTAEITGVTAGNLLVYTHCTGSGGVVSSISDSSGNTWESAVSVNYEEHPGSSVWFCKNASSGTHTLTVTFTIGLLQAQRIIEISGASATNPYNSNGAARGITQEILTPHASGLSVTHTADWIAIASYAFYTAYAVDSGPSGYTVVGTNQSRLAIYSKTGTGSSTENPALDCAATEEAIASVVVFGADGVTGISKSVQEHLSFGSF